ncbi:MAG: hypothetical protein RR626_00370 [Anaerovoracaceae bacterium]
MSNIKIIVYDISNRKSSKIPKTIVLSDDAITINYLQGLKKIEEYVFNCAALESVRWFTRENKLKRNILGKAVYNNNKDAYYIKITLKNSKSYIYRISKRSVKHINAWRKNRGL